MYFITYVLDGRHLTLWYSLYLLAKLVYGFLLCLISTEKFYVYKGTLKNMH